MRRLTPLFLLLSLSGCSGFGEFLDHAFSLPGENPYIPMTDSENYRRAVGQERAVHPLEVEPGNVWPRFDVRDPDSRRRREQPRPRGPARLPRPPLYPARSLACRPVVNHAPAAVRHHRAASSLAPQASRRPTYRLRPPTSAAPSPPGGIVNTHQGPAVDTGGTNSYRQLNTPSGPGAIIVPNGNGTSTIINPNGSVQTVPTPR